MQFSIARGLPKRGRRRLRWREKTLPANYPRSLQIQLRRHSTARAKQPYLETSKKGKDYQFNETETQTNNGKQRVFERLSISTCCWRDVPWSCFLLLSVSPWFGFCSAENFVKHLDQHQPTVTVILFPVLGLRFFVDLLLLWTTKVIGIDTETNLFSRSY